MSRDNRIIHEEVLNEAIGIVYGELKQSFNGGFVYLMSMKIVLSIGIN